MKKRILALVLAVCLVVGVVPSRTHALEKLSSSGITSKVGVNIPNFTPQILYYNTAGRVVCCLNFIITSDTGDTFYEIPEIVLFQYADDGKLKSTKAVHPVRESRGPRHTEFYPNDITEDDASEGVNGVRDGLLNYVYTQDGIEAYNSKGELWCTRNTDGLLSSFGAYTYTYSYDSKRNLSRVIHNYGGSDPYPYDITVDSFGRIIKSFGDSASATSRSPYTFSYNDKGQMVEADCFYMRQFQLQFAYDSNGEVSGIRGYRGSDGDMFFRDYTFSTKQVGTNVELTISTKDWGDGGIWKFNLTDTGDVNPAAITALYPENGKVLDKDNPESGTSTTNYADGKLRIFFDKQLKNAGGNRPELDTGVGTLEIHRASDDAVVYQIKSNTEMPFWGENGVWDKAVRLDNATAALDYDTEYYVTMPAGFIQFADGSVSPAIAKGQWGFRTAEYKPLKIDNGKFIHASSLTGKNEQYDFSYDESWFFNSSYDYQHGLTTMSLCAAMAAYGTNNDYGSSNIKNLMRKLGFEDSRIETKYPVPNYDTIGYAIGNKQLLDPSGDKYSLIMVAIRGGGYGNEWGGDFRLGAGKNHEGFDLAKSQVFNALQLYIANHKSQLQPKCKIWITGYSRGAATTNLVAKLLDDGELKDITVEPKDIFAFCFECPQTTQLNTSSELYKNIVNIVNPIDFVTKVAMSRWGYSRYGRTLYLPYAGGMTKYGELQLNMHETYFNEIQGNDLSPLVELDRQARILDTFMNNLADAFISQDKYVQKSQEPLMKIAATALGGDKEDMVQLITGILLVPALANLPIQNFENTNETLGMFLSGAGANAHQAELCLAWLKSLDGVLLTVPSYENAFAPPTYREVFVNCPVNVNVYDSNGTLTGSIINDRISEIENGVVAYIDNNGQKILCLPNEEQYRIELEATDSGTVTYTATEYNMDSGKTEKVVSYYEVDVEKGDTLTGTAENLDSEAGKYPLTLNGGTPLTPTINQSGSAVREHTVNVTASGNGTVTGGGHFVGGEFSKVTATAKSGEDFLGWYVGGQLVSSDAEYRFLVDKQTGLVGKFTQHYKLTACIGLHGKGNLFAGNCQFGLNHYDAVFHSINLYLMLRLEGLESGADADLAGGHSKGILAAALVRQSNLAASAVLDSQHVQLISRVRGGGDGYSTALAAGLRGGSDSAVLGGGGGDFVVFGGRRNRGALILTALDKDGKEISMVNPAESKFTFIMPDSDVTIQAEFKAVWKNPYSDVSEKAWYYGNVRYVTEQGIMHGYDNGKFGPDDELNRAQMTQLLYNKEGKPGAPANTKYNDVTSGSWYAQAVAWADSRNIVNGYGAGKFGPSDPITREQLAAILYRYAGSPKTNGKLDRFSDAEEVSAYAADAMRWAVESGLVKGSGDSLNPKGRATRKEVAAIMQRYLEG